MRNNCLIIDTQETKKFIRDQHPDWKVDGENIEILGAKVTKAEEIPSLKLISQTLAYATELERIV